MNHERLDHHPFMPLKRQQDQVRVRIRLGHTGEKEDEEEGYCQLKRKIETVQNMFS